MNLTLHQAIAVLLVLLVQRPVTGGFGVTRFVEMANRAGITLMNVNGESPKTYIIETVGNGAGFLDYDGDGDMDVVIANGSTLPAFKRGGDLMVYLYNNKRGKFTDVTESSGMATSGWGMGVCVADYDNDGAQDLYVTGFGPNVMYRNKGDGTFVDVTGTAGTGDPHWSTGCAFADYDHDGDVDLYVANYVAFDEKTVPKPGENPNCTYLSMPIFCGPRGLKGEPDTLYRNNGDGTFTNVSREAGITDPGYFGFGVMFTDLNNDGWPDIYVANDSVPNLLFRNNKDGTFSEIGLISGTAASGRGLFQAGMGVAAGDYDADGDPDLFVTNFALDTNTLYQNLGNMNFFEATQVAGLGRVSAAYVGWGAGFVDLDNDGRLDLAVANGHVYPSIDNQKGTQRYFQPKEVYHNLGDGKFIEISGALGRDLLKGKSARGLAFGDFDNDGDIDMLGINLNDRPSLYRNEGGNRNRWITFRLEGTRSNRDAIGARVEIESGGRRQSSEVQSGGSFMSHNDMRVHFGIGKNDRIDAVRVRWPHGETEEFGSMAAGQFVTIREGTGR